MAVSKDDHGPLWRRRTSKGDFAAWLAWLIGAAVVAVCFSLISDKTIWEFVWSAPREAADLGSRMIPPDWSYSTQLWRPLWDTFNIATLGTAIALIISVPVAFCAARNTTPSTSVVRPIALFVIAASRSINSLIWALLLVVIVGPGVFAGVLAIAFRSIGFCGKLLYEAIEEIDVPPVEAVTATGASSGQVLTYGVAPQIMPAFAGISVFRWDINIRESTILGLVGAGGIGLQLSASINNLDWSRVAVILIAILATVIVSEWLSAKIRGALT
ncbi:MAG: phosphonate ABC transporter, permease protein PhnE [Rhodospirillaceae bacterium]|jgi:phosphonate transport system permease protein|nr:phosphonate ABC transporter, permease protein PhnE [Rhodospirillaceae bacterium]MBT5239914.1 phosphonate ABC transporter, permease protein PhnE [Rhodospirillaceae bacterium]MBT5565388.1 phosphonate ABC transporter, permease protein PhnE [Rhodospirillaceae bacterium]MBT6088737.1 phosphonate ABC transporter, permease protein PhnE [Rhodospirillaceae bacterium]MBT7450106.1 phosphonate ABC transporter, permease protein PhnE [Rhodospirillaceae bacterium]